jgi:predicted KAP-like P-loop ATPase
MIIHKFTDDAPKQDPLLDKLGFSPFAKRVAEAIISIDAPNGYVIGLHGPWGSGKSTALNFVQHYISEKDNLINIEKPVIKVIEFKPWIVSGHQDLITSFFKILSEELTDNHTNNISRGK